jgi:hypothetical protein
MSNIDLTILSILAAVLFVAWTYLCFRSGVFIGSQYGIGEARRFKGLYITAERARQTLVKQREILTHKSTVFTSPYQNEIDYPDVIEENKDASN